MSLLASRRYRAQTHAVIAVDIVGSSLASDDLLDPMKTEMEYTVGQALDMCGLRPQDARHVRETGDGLMLAYPEHMLGQLAEVVFYLDHHLRSRNRYARTPMRARTAVHVGPMSDDHRYHRTYITLTRLLTSSTYADTITHWCRRDPTGEKFGAAAVYSRAVWTTVIEPFHAALAPPARCAPITVSTPDYTDTAWIYSPGLEADLALQQPPTRPNHHLAAANLAEPGQPARPSLPANT